jgi:hypothetical protein
MLLKQLHCQCAQRDICFEAQVFQDGCSQHGRDLAIDVCGQVHIFLRSNSGLLATQQDVVLFLAATWLGLIVKENTHCACRDERWTGGPLEAGMIEGALTMVVRWSVSGRSGPNRP